MLTPPPNLQAQCPYCDAAISVHQKINPGYCGSPACLHKHAVRADEKQQAAWREKGLRDLALAKERFLPEIEAQTAEKSIQPDRIFVGTVPYTDAPLIPLPEERRTAYLDHLVKVTHAAFAQELPATEPSVRDTTSEQGEPHPWNSIACATCKGQCCQQQGGKSHAFQSVEHILHMRRTHPEMTAEDMIAHFTNALPEESNEDGCVFQGPQGCVLERADRADICNTFRCRDLIRLAERIDPEATDAIALVSVGDKQAHHMNLLMKRTG